MVLNPWNLTKSQHQIEIHVTDYGNRTRAILDGGREIKDDKLAAQVLTLSDLIDYQEGSVVSRTLVDKKNRNCNLIRL